VLLTIRNRTLNGTAKFLVHPHKPITRPTANLLVAGLLRHVF
jgi:hypothetical protein